MSPYETRAGHNKANSGDANAVSNVRGGRKVGSFAEHQEVAGWAPLIREPFCASQRAFPRRRSVPPETDKEQECHRMTKSRSVTE